jgi:DNA-binding NarL/FixJ family response regulator
VAYSAYPIWLEGLGQVVTDAGVGAVYLTVELSEVVDAVAEMEADLLVIAGPQEALSEMLLAIRQSRGRRPELRVVLMSTADTTESIEAIFAAGASAYLLPSANPGDVAAAIRQAFQPSIYLRPVQEATTGTHEPAGEVASARSARTAPVGTTSELTRRELEILQLAASGRSNGELARLLWVTEQTIKFHLSNIYRKLGVANRTEASRWAQVHGLLDAPDDEGEGGLQPWGDGPPLPVSASPTHGANGPRA